MSDANKIAKHKDPRYDKKINKKNKNIGTIWKLNLTRKLKLRKVI